jgi:hypothetical protein
MKECLKQSINYFENYKDLNGFVDLLLVLDQDPSQIIITFEFERIRAGDCERLLMRLT